MDRRGGSDLDRRRHLSGQRRQQVWDAAALRSTPELLRDAPFDEEVLELPAAPEGEEVVFDYCPDLMNSHTQIGGDHLDNKRDEIETKSL